MSDFEEQAKAEGFRKETSPNGVVYFMRPMKNAVSLRSEHPRRVHKLPIAVPERRVRFHRRTQPAWFNAVVAMVFIALTIGAAWFFSWRSIG